MNNEQLLEKVKDIQDKKEQLEVEKELNKLFNYIKEIECNFVKDKDEIQQFIEDTINKYRFKLEVKNFYNSPTGQDIIGGEYEALNSIKNMITQYVIIKATTSNKYK